MSNRMRLTASLILPILFLITATATARQHLNEHLKPLAPLLGKTFKGTFTNSPDGKMTYDVSRWERALNGQAVRVLHSVNEGEYGGEMILFWDNEKESLVYYYFTTAGFMTTGTMRTENNKFISHEYVKGNQQGITEVKSVSELLPDGTMKGTSQYLQNGTWVDGHAILYREDPTAKVVFR